MSGKPVKGYKSLQLWVILLTPLLIMASATLLYYTGWLNPDTTTNNGTLIDPPIDIADLGIAKDDQQWWLVTVPGDSCNAACEEQLYWVGQVRTALGKNSDRVAQKLLQGDESSMNSQISADHRIPVLIADLDPLPVTYPVQLFVVDPIGNVMMTFGPDNAYEEVLEDMEELLTLSTIG